jgi:hypothetical protein
VFRRDRAELTRRTWLGGTTPKKFAESKDVRVHTRRGDEAPREDPGSTSANWAHLTPVDRGGSTGSKEICARCSYGLPRE